MERMKRDLKEREEKIASLISMKASEMKSADIEKLKTLLTEQYAKVSLYPIQYDSRSTGDSTTTNTSSPLMVVVESLIDLLCSVWISFASLASRRVAGNYSR
jgi:hypothetical protein